MNPLWKVAGRPDSASRGQILVIVAAGIFVLIGMVALVIDGGNAWGQQRDSQNGVDAVSLRGAVRLAENQPYIIGGDPVAYTDADISADLLEIAGKNELLHDVSYYTDSAGTLLPGPITVGSLGDVPPPTGAYGVEAHGHKDFDTFLARVLGVDTLTANVTATARTGPIEGLGAGTVLPVTFPYNITGCDNTNSPVNTADRWELNVHYVVPLCQGGPGNVGWIDWDPTAGGIPDVTASVTNPDNPPLIIPEWYWVTSTGNQSAPMLEDALNSYAVPPAPEENAPPGTFVLIPLFDTHCQADPGGPDDPCTAGPGTGSQLWYHFKDWTAFELDWVNFSGNTGGANDCDTSGVVPGTPGNGSTGCFAGWFRQYLGPGTLGVPDGTETEFTSWGVELIK
jgi:hypothetical protein